MVEEEKVLSPQGKTTTNKESKGKLLKTRAGQEASKFAAEQYKKGWDHAKAGKPVAWIMYGPEHEILQCFDVFDIYPENYGALCAMRKHTSPYVEYSQEDGFSDYICGYLRVALGYARAIGRGESPETAAFGGMPRPTMLLSSGRICDPRVKIFETMRRYLEVPTLIMDQQQPPMEDPRCLDREACEHYIEHNVDELKKLVSFLERQTGKKMDWDRFAEVMNNSIKTWHVFSHIIELRKNIPSPLPTEDLVNVQRPFMDACGQPETLQFYRRTQQEIEERIKSKVSVVPEERFRLLWVGLPTWFDMELFNYMESQGAVSVMETMWHPAPPREVDLSDPLRALAEKRFWGWDFYGGSDASQVRCGLAPGSHVLDLARKYNVDGVIAHTIISCRACSLGNRQVAKVLREQMGLPVLEIESHMTDPRSYSHAEVRESVNTFIHIMEGRK